MALCLLSVSSNQIRLEPEGGGVNVRKHELICANRTKFHMMSSLKISLQKLAVF